MRHHPGTIGGISVVRLVHDLGWLSGRTVYNLNVGDAHNYLVAAPTGTDTLVHNSSCIIAHHHVFKENGVYVLHFASGKKYVGRSVNMHRRVHRNLRSRRFGNDTVTHVKHHVRRGKYATRRTDQSYIDHYGGVRGNQRRLYNRINAMRLR